MRRGTQGHVVPREHLRGVDVMSAYLYLLVIEGYSTYKSPIFGFKLTLIFVAKYIPDTSLLFLPCGTMFPSLFLIQATWQH